MCGVLGGLMTSSAFRAHRQNVVTFLGDAWLCPQITTTILTTSESMRTACAISSTNGTGIPSASPPYIDAEKKARADSLMLCVWWP